MPSLPSPAMTPAFWYSPTRFSKKLVLPLQAGHPPPQAPTSVRGFVRAHALANPVSLPALPTERHYMTLH